MLERWLVYEQRKRKLKEQCLSPEEYEQAIKELAEKLRL